MKNLISILFLLIMFFVKSYGQIETKAFPPKNAFENMKIFKQHSKAKIINKLPSVDINKIIEEEKESEGLDVPFRFGKAFDVNISLKDGSWTSVENGRLWSMEFRSEDAFSLNFVFQKMHLSDGAELFIANEDQSVLYGPVTSKQNFENGVFLTDIIPGNTVTIYLFEPNSSSKESQLGISRIVYGYKNLFGEKLNGNYGGSGSCNIDIVCMDSWFTESNAVALVLLSNGIELCTGSLLQTTDYSFRPFFLSAFHCIDTSPRNGNLSESEISNAQSWMFKFKYTKSHCEAYQPNFHAFPTTGISFNGATFRAAWNESDFALMELNSSQLSQEGLTWLGWDRNSNSPNVAIGIHHPSGDVMKISLSDDILETGYTSDQGTGHWRVNWTDGVTEGGSSGSPLINSNHRVIGQLHGGFSGCGSSDMRDWYGQFHRSWTGGGTNITRLSNWLDPGNTGNMTTNTIRYFPPTISGPSLICSGSTYTVTATNWQTGFTWDKSPNLNLIGSGNTVSVTRISDGPGWVSIKAGNTDLARYTLWVGAPTPENITTQIGYNNTLYARIPYYNDAQALWNVIGGTSILEYNWTCTGWDIIIHPMAEFQRIYYSQVRFVPVNPSSQAYVFIKARNACGWGINKGPIPVNVNLTSGTSGYYSYPNPVSNVLNIERDLELISQYQSLIQKTTDGKTIKVEESYDIRLYDYQGNLLRRTTTKGGKVEFNVANLTNGIYYLHIYDGVNEKPEMRQIVVEH